MKYVKIRWIHTSPDEPVVLYSELNDEFWELRKVECYVDGRVGFADNKEQSGSTRLGIEPLPSLKEIAENLEFQPEVITAEEFEAIWKFAKAW